MKTLSLIILWITGLALVVWAGFLPNPYLEHVRGIPPPHPYPHDGVILVSLLITLETVMLLGILRPWNYSRSWGRSFFGLLLTIAFFILAAIYSMHAPRYLAYYLGWNLLMAAGLMGLLVWSGIARARYGRSI